MRNVFLTFFMKCVNNQVLTYSVITGMLKVVVVAVVVTDTRGWEGARKRLSFKGGAAGLNS